MTSCCWTWYSRRRASTVATVLAALLTANLVIGAVLGCVVYLIVSLIGNRSAIRIPMVVATVLMIVGVVLL